LSRVTHDGAGKINKPLMGLVTVLEAALAKPEGCTGIREVSYCNL
jgi:hypothetical protein